MMITAALPEKNRKKMWLATYLHLRQFV